MFKRVLIANRGEIANRIVRTLDELEIESVVLYDSREKDTSYVNKATVSVSLGTGLLADTFLNIDRIITIAKEKACDAIHPGYGFLAENADFARQCNSNGIVFIGPDPDTIDMIGNKLKAVEIAKHTGIPVIQYKRGTIKELSKTSSKDWFPCLVKASAGGGGKGMRKVNNAVELKEFLKRTSVEAFKYFGNGAVYIEKYLEDPRHIEVQILADNHGNVIHLFERECSVQRRYQKIIEEAPAVGLNKLQKETLYNHALILARHVGYKGAGTVEFLIDNQGNHFFLEMNTRIQVEHGISELITGVDIVKEQLSIAAGSSFSTEARKARINGHAIEVRLYTEDPANEFKPSSGKISLLRFPQKKNIRIDTDYSSGSEILSDYDSMIAKIMAHGENRLETINNMKEALRDTILHGVKNNLASSLNILSEPDFLRGGISTNYLLKHTGVLYATSDFSLIERNLLLSAGLFISMFNFPIKNRFSDYTPQQEFWRIQKIIKLFLDNDEFTIHLNSINSDTISFIVKDRLIEARLVESSDNYIEVETDDLLKRIYFSWNKIKLTVSLSIDYREYIFKRDDFLPEIDFSGRMNGMSFVEFGKIPAPLNGKVIKINIKNNQKAREGDTLMIIESMKMENEIRLPSPATIKEVLVREGQMVREGDILIHLELVN